LRIAHATDIHWTTDCPLGRLPGKRILGTANQYLKGRRHHFPRDVQRALVQHILDLEPDVFVLTGDLTAQALPEEFACAKADLEPVLEAVPTVILPGNHDRYTRGATTSKRLEDSFAPWMHLQQTIGRFEEGEVTILTLDPNRPTFIHASGEVPSKQLEELRETLDSPELDGRFVVLALHYPVLDRHGAVYDGVHHGLLNARELIELLKGCRNKPSLLIHGHEHHGYRVELDLGDGHVATCIDCGSSGYAYMPEKRRAAAMAVYTVEDGAFTVERYLHDGEAFAPEAGGAFATGR
jgi:3',5'-cyclic AMP phosphodiesterase CpdA